MNYQDIAKVNKEIKTEPIKGKQYAEVNSRVDAFRKLYPEGSIVTEILSVNDDHCIIRATVSTAEGVILGTGTAREDRNASPINRQSFVENCETSAIGRALGFCGLGIEASIASAEELHVALAAQEAEAPKAAPGPAPESAPVVVKWYQKERMDRAKAEQPAPAPEPAESPVVAKCADCGKDIEGRGKYTPEAIAKKTHKTYGRMLCWECAEKANEARKAKGDA